MMGYTAARLAHLAWIPVTEVTPAAGPGDDDDEDDDDFSKGGGGDIDPDDDEGGVDDDEDDDDEDPLYANACIAGDRVDRRMRLAASLW